MDTDKKPASTSKHEALSAGVDPFIGAHGSITRQMPARRIPVAGFLQEGADRQ